MKDHIINNYPNMLSRFSDVFILSATLLLASSCSTLQNPAVDILANYTAHSEFNREKLETLYSEETDYTTYIYKETPQAALRARVWKPAVTSKRSDAAILFLYGGGWKNGTIEHFSRQASYFSQLGIVSATVDYRVSNIHGTDPATALQDAKSAIRWFRARASEFGFDPDKLIVAGGSAGGHLAAAASLVGGFNDPVDDLSISTVANYLVLFNPVIDNGPEGYGHDRVKAYWKEFSPIHNITDQHPPTLFMVGTKDELIPVGTAQSYIEKIKATGSYGRLSLYEDQTHAFFNTKRFVETLRDMHDFLYHMKLIPYPPPK